MKRFSFWIVAAAVVALMMLMDACDEVREDGTNDTILDAMVIVRTVRGHDYVIFRTGHGCIAALHAESCPCKEAGEKCRESK